MNLYKLIITFFPKFRLHIKECFSEHDADNNKNLSFDEFVHFYDELTKRPELLEIFENYSVFKVVCRIWSILDRF